MEAEMKRFLLLVVFLLVGCGDVGSSSNSNTVESNQVFNPDPVNCQTDCTLNVETGTVAATHSCSGGTPFGIPTQSLDDCDTITEVAPLLVPDEETEDTV